MLLIQIHKASDGNFSNKTMNKPVQLDSYVNSGIDSYVKLGVSSTPAKQ